jgi:hypothetical protein
MLFYVACSTIVKNCYTYAQGHCRILSFSSPAADGSSQYLVKNSMASEIVAYVEEDVEENVDEGGALLLEAEAIDTTLSARGTRRDLFRAG